MLEHGHWAPPHRWPLWKWPIKPSFQTTIDLFTRGNLKPTPNPKRNTLIQALTDLRPLKIAVRDRLYTRCEWGQKWGHNSIFSGCNCHSRALSKCFLGIRIVFRGRWAGCLAGYFRLFMGHGDLFTFRGLLRWEHICGHALDGLKRMRSLRSSELLMRVGGLGEI